MRPSSPSFPRAGGPPAEGPPLALFVNDLEAAERFYTAAFGLELLFREVETPEGEWLTLRPGTSWDDARSGDLEITMVALQRDRFTLAVCRGDPRPGTVLEVGITVPEGEIAAIDARLPEEATRIRHEYDDLYFADTFGFPLARLANR